MVIQMYGEVSLYSKKSDKLHIKSTKNTIVGF